jgi:hypothetical protein
MSNSEEINADGHFFADALESVGPLQRPTQTLEWTLSPRMTFVHIVIASVHVSQDARTRGPGNAPRIRFVTARSLARHYVASPWRFEDMLEAAT